MKESISKEVKKDLVVQHNDLIQAQYYLTLQEKRVIIWLSSQVKKDDEDFKDHEIKIKPFCDLSEIKSKNMYREIEKTTESLMKKVFKIRNKRTNSMIQISWLSCAEYFYSEGRVVLRFDPKLKEYLLNLNQNFTSYSLQVAMRLKSVYSVRFYEIAKQYLKIGSFQFKIQELKKCFQIDDKKYKKYNDIKKRIIIVSLKEISEKSDVFLDFQEIKEGKRVVSLKFFVKHNTGYVGDQSDQKQKDLLPLPAVKESLSKIFSDEQIEKGMQVLNTYNGEVKSPERFLRKAIKEGWKPFEKEATTDKKEPKKTHPDKDSIIKQISEINETQLCKKVRMSFLAKEGLDVYSSWIAPVSLTLEDGKLSVLCASGFVADWIDVNYKQVLKTAIEEVEEVLVVQQETSS